MVYRGRPSTGCKTCRERKVKVQILRFTKYQYRSNPIVTNSVECDETPGGCQKCGRAGVRCPGYDRNVDAFFHDETARTEVRAKKAKAKAIALRDRKSIGHKVLSTISGELISSTLVEPNSSPSGLNSSPSIDLIPSPSAAQDAYIGSGFRRESPGILLLAPLIDQGIAYFMSHYAIGLDQPSIHSDAYNKHLATNGFHPLVATSMTALGLAGVANIYQNTALKSKATKWYLDAIKMTNNALVDPKHVRSDTTLLAITLLGLFEATSNEYTLHAYGEHVAGAASLVKVRGVGQFASPAGCRMYLHAIGLLTMNCLVDGTALPPYVQEMNKEVKKRHDDTDPRNRFFFLQQDIVNLRAEIMDSPAMSLQSILDQALALDAVAAKVFEHAGPEWRYEVVPLMQPTPCVYGSTYHVYPSHAAAQTWNWVRYTTIYIHDIIRNTLLAGLATSPPVFTGAHHLHQLARSIDTLNKSQSDILASAPQFLHDVPKIAPQDTYPSPLPSPSNSSPEAFSTTTPFSTPKLLSANFRTEHPSPPSPSSPSTDRLPIVRVSGGHSTLWALYIAGAMPTAESTAQEFVGRCFGRFEREFGIMQAKVLAGALRVKMSRVEKEGGICPEYLPSQGAPYVVEGSLAGHQVLYKGDFRGTMVLNSAVTPEDNFLLPDGSINISAMVSGTMGDFNGWRAAYYLTPDFGVAQQYQKWAADRNKDSESWIVRFEVPDTYIDSLRREELWYGADFKRFVWISRRGQNTLMVPHLVKYDAAELIVGHTLKYPYLIDRPAERVQDDWSGKLVDDEATGEKAVQWCFDYTCAAGLRDAVRGKVHVDVFGQPAALEGPVKK